MGRILLSEQDALVTLDDFISTYKNPKHFAVEKKVEFLKEKNLIPFTYVSELFTKVNILISAIMWTGSISESSASKPKVILSIGNDYRDSFKKGIQDLEVSLANETLGKNGSPYARLIKCIPGIFYSRGDRNNPDRKCSRKFTFPNYLH